MITKTNIKTFCSFSFDMSYLRKIISLVAIVFFFRCLQFHDPSVENPFTKRIEASLIGSK